MFSDLCRHHLFILIVHLFLQVDKDCSGVKLKVSFQLRLFQLSEIIGVELNKPGAILFESPPSPPSFTHCPSFKGQLGNVFIPSESKEVLQSDQQIDNHEALFRANCVIHQIPIAQYPLFIVSVIH